MDLPFLYPAIMRGIISQIGQQAGLSAVYWKYGVCLYEWTTRSQALIEQRLSSRPNTWSGRIVVSTRGGQALELLGQLREWIKARTGTLRLPGLGNQGNSAPSAWPTRRKPAGVAPWSPNREDAVRERALEFTPPPSDTIPYCVSYAWNDESKAMVDRLCEEANRRGIKQSYAILTGLGLGESISRFMQRLGSGDRVFVILSDKYLKSPYCMYELLEVWRNCKVADEEFRQSHPGLPPAGCQDVEPT